MAHYLLIESRDPFDSADTASFWELAANLRAHGDDVTLFLVQNGALAARKGPKSARLSALAKDGVVVLVDDFSLRERGIQHVAEGVAPAKLDVVVDRLEAGAKALWH